MTEDDRDDKAYAYVGRFMKYFVALDATVANSIHRVFRFSALQKNILCLNLDFSRKVSILYSAFDRSPNKMKPYRARINTVFNGLREMNDIRTIVTTTFFDYAKDLPEGGVVFHQRTARQGYKVELVTWSDSDADEVYLRILQLAQDVTHLSEHLLGKSTE